MGERGRVEIAYLFRIGFQTLNGDQRSLHEKKKTEKQNSVHFLFQLRARQVLTQKTRERRERKKNEKRRQRIHRTLLLSRLSSRSSVSSRRPRPNHFTSLKEITSSNFLISLSLSLCLSEGKKEDNSCSFFRRIR